MKDPTKEIQRIDSKILGLEAWIIDLAYSHVATQRVLSELLPTMTPEQQKIMRRYRAYKDEMTEEALIKAEVRDPRHAALLSSLFERRKSPQKLI